MNRIVTAIALCLVVAALTYFVSRLFGFTLILLPLFFTWGRGSRRG